MEHPGYKLYLTLVEEQRRNRVREIVGADASSLDELIHLGNIKKELAGIQFAAGLPTLMTDELTLEIKEILVELEGDENELDE